MKFPFFLLIFFLLITGCDADYLTARKERKEYAEEAEKAIIGLAWSPDDALARGVELAVREINDSDVLGDKEIYVQTIDDGYGDNLQRDDLNRRVRHVARTFASNQKVVAVIGHRSSAAALPASITYEYFGVVFFAPTATHWPPRPGLNRG